jgi:uncharacterized Zn finger protein
VPSFNVDATGIVEVTNESHDNPAEHQYVISIDDVTKELMACTCPHHIHRNAFCKHMAAVETATDDGRLTAFPSEDDETDEDDVAPIEQRPRISERCLVNALLASGRSFQSAVTHHSVELTIRLNSFYQFKTAQ